MDRRLWTQEEDQHILRLVAKFGTKKWPLISERLGSETGLERTGKQCRQRWYNHLSPEISSAVWSEQDQYRLFEAHKQYGNKWKIISKLFEGRTDNSIKNHFYSTIRRCLRRINKFQGEKNSTLKMRAIKPYVLSKILADKNLTQIILELGKIKPNQFRQEAKSEFLEQFNQMIKKLYQINKEYEIVKINKKGLIEKKLNLDDKFQSEEQPLVSKEDEERNYIMEKSHKNNFHNESKTKQSIIIQNTEKKQKIKRNVKFSKIEQRIIKRKKGSRTKHFELAPQVQKYKQINQEENKYSRSSKRFRKSINYMKLNQGIMCENDQQYEIIEENNQIIELNEKKQNCIKSKDYMSLEEKFLSNDKLQLLMQEQEKFNEKENIESDRNHFNYDDIEIKGLRHFQISNPSPCYNKISNFFDDLVVIGTHLKLHTPRQNSNQKANYQSQKIENIERKQNQEEFIEQILQINFDPEFALKFGQENDQASEK